MVHRGMTAKEYLRQYEYADKRAKRFRAEYDKECELIDAIHSSVGDGMPHGSNISRETEHKALRLAEKAEKWKHAEAIAIEKRQEVFDVISDIDGAVGDILYERYINLCKWEKICITVNLSWRQVHRLHSEGLRAVEQKMA